MALPLTPMTRAAALFLALGLLPSCESARDRTLAKEDHLAAAGFAFQPANTPERQAMLNRLPAHRFVTRMRDGQPFYIYSDPAVCDCLYVGDQSAYARYQQYRQAKALADEQQFTAMEYQDASWNWGAWGPWGGGPWVGRGWYGWNPSWGNWDPGMGPVGW
ncbi:MAG: hypothetical protein ABF990_13775 [Acetobacter sp.]|uniref:hypothetical protein n=3 Tax=Acetobacter sp. TaxID=440 RepID=UPI0039EA4FAE